MYFYIRVSENYIISVKKKEVHDECSNNKNSLKNDLLAVRVKTSAVPRTIIILKIFDECMRGD